MLATALAVTLHADTPAADATIRTARYEAVISPALGRMIRLGAIGGRNLLWVNPEARPAEGYFNAGGDKLWPAPQSLWTWPPDPDLDGAAHTVAVSGNTITLTSPVARATGIQFVRIFTFKDESTLTIENRLINAGPRAMRVSPWQVMQIIPPERVETVGSMDWEPFEGFTIDRRYATPVDGRMTFRRDPKASYKIGARAGTRFRAFWSDAEIEFRAEQNARGSYADQYRGMQLYSSADPTPYMELEALGEHTVIPPGKFAVLLTTIRFLQ